MNELKVFETVMEDTLPIVVLLKVQKAKRWEQLFARSLLQALARS